MKNDIPILKPKEFYNNLKRFFNQHYNSISKKFIDRSIIGSCSYLMQKYTPTSYQDFANKYFTDYNDYFNYDTIKGDKHCGRSLKQFNSIVQKYCDLINDTNVTFDMCFDDLLNHVIIETFDGHFVESYLVKKLKDNNKFEVDEIIDYLDAIGGIDIWVKEKVSKKTKAFVQVKPISFFLGNRKEGGLIADRINALKKQEVLNEYLIKHGLKDEILPIKYVIYNKSVFDNTGKLKFLKLNGKTKFNLEELLNFDGTTKLIYNEIKDSFVEI